MSFDPEILLAELKRFLSWAFPSFLGVSAKLAFESRLKRVTRARVITSIILACFVGYLTDKVCTHYQMDSWRGILVALGALASESIVQYLMTNTAGTVGELVRKLLNLDRKKPQDEGSDTDVK